MRIGSTKNTVIPGQLPNLSVAKVQGQHLAGKGRAAVLSKKPHVYSKGIVFPLVIYLAGGGR